MKTFVLIMYTVQVYSTILACSFTSTLLTKGYNNSILLDIVFDFILVALAIINGRNLIYAKD